MSEIFQLSESGVIDVIFAKSGVPSTVIPAPTFELRRVSDNTLIDSGTLAAVGSAYPYTFSQAAGALYRLTASTSDAAADYLTFIEEIRVGQTWLQYINTSLAVILAAINAISLTGIPAAVWAYLTTLIVTPGSIGEYILAKLGLITADNVAIAVPVDPDNLQLTLYNDTSYLPASGVALPTWTNSAWTVYGLTTATVTFYWIDKNSIIDTALGTMVVDSATSIHLTVAHTDVFTLPLGIGVMGYKIVAVLDVAHGSEEVQLVNAALSHLNYVQFPPEPNTQP